MGFLLCLPEGLFLPFWIQFLSVAVPSSFPTLYSDPSWKMNHPLIFYKNVWKCLFLHTNPSVFFKWSFFTLDVMETHQCGECRQHRDSAKRRSNLGRECLLHFTSNAELKEEWEHVFEVLDGRPAEVATGWIEDEGWKERSIEVKRKRKSKMKRRAWHKTNRQKKRWRAKMVEEERKMAKDNKRESDVTEEMDHCKNYEKKHTWSFQWKWLHDFSKGMGANNLKLESLKKQASQNHNKCITTEKA